MSFTIQSDHKLVKLVKKAYSHKVLRYILSGGLSAAVDITAFTLAFNLLFHKHDVMLGQMTFNAYSVALVISYTIGSISSFLMNKFFVFSAKTAGLNQLLKSLPVYIMAFAANLVLLKFFIEIFHLWPTVSRIISALLVAFITFNLHKHFTFRQKNQAND